MKVLITGGAGFIGSTIVEALNNDKDRFEVVVLDSLTTQIHGEQYEKSYLYQKIKNKCHFIKGDVCDYKTVEQAVDGCDCIIHLAAETGTGQSMYQINQYNGVNVMGTSNLFQALVSLQQKPNKFILASSRSVYGEGKYKCKKHGIVYPGSRKAEDMKNGDFSMHCPICNSTVQVQPTDENSLINPGSLYAFTKFSQEKMVETMCRALGIDYTIFRFQNVYGVGQSLKNPYTGILSIFSTLLLEDKNVNIFEDGNESRDFVNVNDVALAVLKSIREEKSNQQIINLGSGTGTSVMEIAKKLRAFYDSRSKLIITGDFRIGDIAHNIADITQAKKILDYEPKTNLDEGLRLFANWVMHQETDNSQYERSLEEMESTGMFIRGKQ